MQIIKRSDSTSQQLSSSVSAMLQRQAHAMSVVTGATCVELVIAPGSMRKQHKRKWGNDLSFIVNDLCCS